MWLTLQLNITYLLRLDWMKKDCKMLDWRIYYGWDIFFRTVDSIMTVLSVFRKVVKKVQCIQSQLNSLGLACTAEDIGSVLASSPLIENSDSAQATEIKDCRGNMYFCLKREQLVFYSLFHHFINTWSLGKPGRVCGKCIQALQHSWPADKRYLVGQDRCWPIDILSTLLW